MRERHAERNTIARAEDVFRQLGAALLEMQLFTNDHPRFLNAIDKLETLVQTFYAATEARNIAFTLRRGQIEYRKVPLLNTGAHGERLIETLRDGDIGGIQLEREAKTEDFQQTIEAIYKLARPQLDGMAPTTRSSAFRLLSTEYVKNAYEAGDDDLADEDGEIALPQFQVSRRAAQSVLSSYESLSQSLTAVGEFDYGLLSGATDDAVDSTVYESPYLFPAGSRAYFDDFTFHHSVNVCLLATHMCSKLTNNRELLQRIAMATLLHDVGKSRIPAEILHKPARLTPSERRCLETHPALGAETLCRFEDVDPMAIAVAFGHHRHDGAGSYPKGAPGFESDWVTDLVGVIDIFEALTGMRPYKPPLPAETAFRIMLKMDDLKQRVGYVKLIYDCLGPFPLGGIVELSSGDWGEVCAINRANPYRPRLKLLADRYGRRIKNEYVLDLAALEGKDRDSLKITRAIVSREPYDDPIDQEPAEIPEKVLDAPLTENRVLMAREG